MTCPVCDGSGKLLSKVCPLCDGLHEESPDEDAGHDELTLAVKEAMVTVRRMDGEVLFGPVCLLPNTPVPILRDDVLEACLQANLDACEVCLFDGAHELADDEFLLGDESVEILAVLRSLDKLSLVEREIHRRRVFDTEDYDPWGPFDSKYSLEAATASLPAAARADRELMLEIVSCCGMGLQYAHKFLKADRFVVMTAVADEGDALQYAHDSLRADVEVVRTAVSGPSHNRCRESALLYVHRSLKTPRMEAALVKDVLIASSDHSSILKYVSPELKADREFMREVTLRQHNCLRHASKALKSDKDFVLGLVMETGAGRLLYQVHEDLREDPDILAHVRHRLM